MQTFFLTQLTASDRMINYKFAHYFHFEATESTLLPQITLYYEKKKKNTFWNIYWLIA